MNRIIASAAALVTLAAATAHAGNTVGGMSNSPGQGLYFDENFYVSADRGETQQTETRQDGRRYLVSPWGERQEQRTMPAPTTEEEGYHDENGRMTKMIR